MKPEVQNVSVRDVFIFNSYENCQKLTSKNKERLRTKKKGQCISDVLTVNNFSKTWI